MTSATPRVGAAPAVGRGAAAAPGPRAAPGRRAAPAAAARAAARGRAAVAAAAAVVAELLLDHLVDEALSGHAALGAHLGALVVAEDDQALLAAAVERHEHVGPGLLLHAAQLAAAVSGHPALAVIGDVHLGAVVAVGDVLDGDAAAALRQEPVDELPAPPALLEVPGDEGHVADVLEDGAGGVLELLAGRALLPEGVAELVVLEDQPVGVEALRVRRLVADAPREVARGLGLDAAHDLQLRAAARALRAADDQHLGATAALALLAVLVHEEHEHAPLLLHLSERGAPRPSDVANAIAGNVHDRAVVAVLPAVDPHGTLELIEEPLHVLLRLLALGLRAGEERDVADVLNDGARGALQLLARASLLAQGVGELVVLEGHGVRAPGLALVLAPVAVHDVVPELVEVARALRLHRAEHLELRAAASTDTAEDRQLLEVLVAAPALLHLAEEHQGGPLLLDGAQEVAGASRDEADGFLRDLQHGEIPVVVVVGDRHGARPLRHHALGVLLRLAPLELRAADLEDEVALEELDLGLGHAGDLLLRLAALAEDEGRVVVGDLDGVDAVVLRPLVPRVLLLARATAVLAAAPAAALAALRLLVLLLRPAPGLLVRLLLRLASAALAPAAAIAAATTHRCPVLS
mmetsp:Transcript_27411/g.81637  ORF Transcript_27411/g.81637 Transcript_27411/m.81637 type:complete len:637 (+) Transcript_27411:157-2067(+)